MARPRLTTDVVVATAAAQLDRRPGAPLTLSEVAAKLGVRAPSLYNHVAGLDDVMGRIALAGIAELGDALRSAVMGRSGGHAIAAMAHAYRRYAASHPGVYPLTQRTWPESAEYDALAARAIEPVQAVLNGAGLTDEALIHGVRTIRSALHGFVLLEMHQGFGLAVDVDTSFESLVTTLTRGVVDPCDQST